MKPTPEEELVRELSEVHDCADCGACRDDEPYCAEFGDLLAFVSAREQRAREGERKRTLREWGAYFTHKGSCIVHHDGNTCDCGFLGKFDALRAALRSGEAGGRGLR